MKKDSPADIAVQSGSSFYKAGILALWAAVVHTKKGAPTSYDVGAPRSTAATYSPNWCVSTIGARGLNCSVRYGKRWDPAAKATANIT